MSIVEDASDMSESQEQDKEKTLDSGGIDNIWKQRAKKHQEHANTIKIAERKAIWLA